jgi:hypothetical protein
LIPGGTGFPTHHNIKLVPLAEPIPEEEMLPAATESADTAMLQKLLGENA